MARLLSAAEIRQLLEEFVSRLSELGDPADIYVIGGAAVALQNPDRMGTTDIDGYIRPVDAPSVVAELQQKWGLEADWFNWKAQGLQPPVAGREMWHEVMRSGPVVLFAAKSEALLGMKLFAARERDMHDIRFLMRACGVASVADAEEVFDRYYPGEGLSRRAVARVEHASAEADGSESRRRPPLGG